MVWYQKVKDMAWCNDNAWRSDASHWNHDHAFRESLKIKSNLYLFARDFVFTFPFFIVLLFVTKFQKNNWCYTFIILNLHVCGIGHFISCSFICASVFLLRPYDLFVQESKTYSLNPVFFQLRPTSPFDVSNFKIL